MEWTAQNFDGQVWPASHDDDPMNMGFPCHPRIWGFSDEDPPDFRGHHQRRTCPSCGVKYWVRLHRFDDSQGHRGVFEWASVRAGVTRVYPVPPMTVMGGHSPLWADLSAVQERVSFEAGVAHSDEGATFTTQDLRSRGYQGVLVEARARVTDLSTWKGRDLGLVAMALPVTVGGRVVAEPGDVLLARLWWRLPGHAAVVAFCPREARSVVMCHSYAVVPVPEGFGL